MEKEYCCYKENEGMECTEEWCDECDFCPDSLFDEDEEDEEDDDSVM